MVVINVIKDSVWQKTVFNENNVLVFYSNTCKSIGTYKALDFVMLKNNVISGIKERHN
jgi:hypothetical protein